MIIINVKDNFDARVNKIKNSSYLPASREEILNMDYMDLKLYMAYNIAFFDAALVLLSKELDLFLDEVREWEESLSDVRSINELLNDTVYFGRNYEASRNEFINVILDYLWDYAQYIDNNNI